MTAVNIQATEILPLGGSNSAGLKVGFIKSGAKAAQNDTWVVTNATKILAVYATLDATGGTEATTNATNVITLTSATATACSALVIFI